MEKKITEIRGVRIGEGIPKICVPLTDRTIEELAVSAAQAAASTADMAEWRLDWFEGIGEDEQIREAARTIRDNIGELPLLVTIRTKEEGGGLALALEEYRRVNLMLAEERLADLIDVQVFYCGSSAEELVRAIQGCGVKAVGSWHHFEMTPRTDDMEERFRGIGRCGADICKLAVMPKGPRDVMRLMETARTMREEMNQPLIAISMGGYGFASRIAGECFGSDVTFGAVGNTSAPGQLPVSELRKLLMAVHLRKKIVLIGFMGCGKTTLGKTLAYGTGSPLCDTDQMIESAEGITISQIFAEKGEAYFRERERAVLRELGEQEGMMIVSTGGGLPMNEANHEPLKALGLVVFLEVSKEMVLERLKGDTTRPLLSGGHPEKRVEELLKVRTPVYEKAADIKIVTG